MNRSKPQSSYNDYLKLLENDQFALTKSGQQIFGQILSGGLKRGEINQEEYKQLIDAQQLRLKQVMNTPLVNPLTGQIATKIFAPRTPLGGGAGPQEVIQTGKDLFVGGSMRPDVLSNQVLGFRQQAIAGGEQLQKQEAQQLQQLLSLLTPKPTDISGQMRVAGAKIGGALEGLSTSLGVQGVPFFPKPTPQQLATTLLDDYSTITPETAMESVAQEGRAFGASLGSTLGPLATGSLLTRAAQPIGAMTGLAKNRYGAFIMPAISAATSFIGSQIGGKGVEMRMRSIYGDDVYENEIMPILAQSAMENPDAAFAGQLASVPLQGGLNLASGIGTRAFGGTLLNTLRNRPTTIIGRASDLGPGAQKLADAASAGQILQNTVNAPNKFSAFTSGLLQRIGQTSDEAIDSYVKFQPTGSLGQRLGQFGALQNSMPGMSNFTADLVGEQAFNLGFAAYDYVDGWRKYNQGLASAPPSAQEALINLGMGALFIRDNAMQNAIASVGAGIGRGALFAGSKIPGVSQGIDALRQRYVEGNLGYIQAMAEQQFADVSKGVVPTAVGGLRQRFGGMATPGEIRARGLVGNEVPVSIGNGQIAAYDPTSNAVRLLNYRDVYPVAADQEMAERGGMLAQQLEGLPVERIGKGVLGKIAALGGKDVVKGEGPSRQSVVGVIGNHVIVRENPMASDGKSLAQADYSIMRVADLEPNNQGLAQQMFDDLGVEAATDPYKFDPAVPRVGAPSLYDVLTEQQDIEGMFPKGSPQNKLIKDWFKTRVYFGGNLQLRGRVVGKAKNGDALVQLMGYDTAIVRVNPVNLDSRTMTKPGEVVSLQEVLDEGQMSEAKKQFLSQVPSLYENPNAGMVMRNIGKRQYAVAMTGTQVSQFKAAMPALQQAINNIDPAVDAATRQTLVDKYTNNLIDSIFKPTFKKTTVKYQPGTLVTAQMPGGLETGVVIENSDYGPVVAFGSNGWQGVLVQPSSIKSGKKAELTFEEAEEAEAKAAKPEPAKKGRKKEPVEGEAVVSPEEPTTQKDYDATEERPGDFADVVKKFKDHVFNKMNDAQRRAINGLDQFIDVVDLDPESGEYSRRRSVPVFDDKGNNLYHSAIKKINDGKSNTLNGSERAILKALLSPDWTKGKNTQFWRGQLMIVNYLENPRLRNLVRKLFLMASDPDLRDQLPNIFVNDLTGADEDLSPMPDATDDPVVVPVEPVDFDVAPVVDEEPVDQTAKPKPVPIDFGPPPPKKTAGIVLNDELIIAFLDADNAPDEDLSSLVPEARRHVIAERILLGMSAEYQGMQSALDTRQVALSDLEAAYQQLAAGKTPAKVLKEAADTVQLIRNSANKMLADLQRARTALINAALDRQGAIDEIVDEAKAGIPEEPTTPIEETPKTPEEILPKLSGDRDVNGDSYWLDNYDASNKTAEDFINRRIPGFIKPIEKPTAIVPEYEFELTDPDAALLAFNDNQDINQVLRLYSKQSDFALATRDIRNVISFLQLAKTDFDLGRDENGKLSDIAQQRLVTLNSYIAKLESELDWMLRIEQSAIYTTETKLLKQYNAWLENEDRIRAEQEEARRQALATPRKPKPIIVPDNADVDVPDIDILEDIQATPIQRVAVENLSVDPSRFQFRVLHSGSSGFGASGSTTNIEAWEDELAGIVNVWKDPADGKTYVVNGHNRYALARRFGVPNLYVRYMTATSDTEALVRGALINIAEDHATAIDIAKILKLRPELLKQILQYVKKDRPIVQQGINMSRLPDNILSAAIQESNDAAKIRLYSVLGSNDQMDDKRYQLLWQKIRSSDNLIRPGVTIEGIEERIQDLIGSDLLVDTSQGPIIPGMEGFEAFRSASEDSVELRGAIRRYIQKEAKILGQTLREQNKRILEKAGTSLDPETASAIRNANIDVIKEWSRIWRFDKPLQDYVNGLAAKSKQGANWDAVVQANLEEIKKQFQDARMRFLSGVQGVGTIEGIDGKDIPLLSPPKQPDIPPPSPPKQPDIPKPPKKDKTQPYDEETFKLYLEQLKLVGWQYNREYYNGLERAILAQQLIDSSIMQIGGVRTNVISPEAWRMSWDAMFEFGMEEMEAYEYGGTNPNTSNFAALMERVFVTLDEGIFKKRNPRQQIDEIQEVINDVVRDSTPIDQLSEAINSILLVPRKNEEWKSTPENLELRENLEYVRDFLIDRANKAAYEAVWKREFNTNGSVWWETNTPHSYTDSQKFYLPYFENEYAKVLTFYRQLKPGRRENSEDPADYTFQKPHSDIRKEAIVNVVRQKSEPFKNAWAKYVKSKLLSDMFDADNILESETADFLRVYEYNKRLEGELLEDQVEPGSEPQVEDDGTQGGFDFLASQNMQVPKDGPTEFDWRTVKHPDSKTSVNWARMNAFKDNAWGATSYTVDDNYRAFTMFMKPSDFLKLSPPLKYPKNIDAIRQAMVDGTAIAPPFLKVDYDFNNNKWIVIDHEGRHRSLAAMQLDGDELIPVQIVLSRMVDLEGSMSGELRVNGDYSRAGVTYPMTLKPFQPQGQPYATPLRFTESTLKPLQEDGGSALLSVIMETAVSPRSDISADSNILNLTDSDKRLLRDSGFMRDGRIDFGAINILGSEPQTLYASEIQSTDFPSNALYSQAFTDPNAVNAITLGGEKFTYNAVRIRDKNSLAINIKRLLAATAKGKTMGEAKQTQVASSVADYMNMMAHAVVSRRLRAMADASVLGTLSKRYQGGAQIPSTRKQASFISYDDFVSKDIQPLYAKFREIFNKEYTAAYPGKQVKRLTGEQIFQSKDKNLVQIRASALAKLAEQEVIEFFENRFPAIGHLLNPALRQGGTVRGAVVTTVQNATQQRVLFAFYNSNIEVILHEIAHAWLYGLPYFAASELASAMGKTLRQPTPTHPDRIPIEMHEEFAYGLMVSFSNINLENADKKLGWVKDNAVQESDPNNAIIKNLAAVGKLVREVYNSINDTSNLFANVDGIAKKGDNYFGTWRQSYQQEVKNPKTGQMELRPNPKWYLWNKAPVMILERDKDGNPVATRLAQIVGDWGTLSKPSDKVRVRYSNSNDQSLESWSSDTHEIFAKDIDFIGGVTNGVSPAVQEIMSKWIAANGGYLGLENSVPEEREAAYQRDGSLIDNQLALEFGVNYNSNDPNVTRRRDQLIGQGFDIVGVKPRSIRPMTEPQKARWLGENFRIGRISTDGMKEFAESIGSENINLLWQNRISLARSFGDDPLGALQANDAKGAALVALHRAGVRHRLMARLRQNATEKRPDRQSQARLAQKTLENPANINRLVDIAFHNHLANLIAFAESRDEIRRIVGNLKTDRKFDIARNAGNRAIYNKNTKTIRIKRIADGKLFDVNLTDGSVLDIDKIPELTDAEIEYFEAVGQEPIPGQSVASWYAPANRLRREMMDGGDPFPPWKAASMWSYVSENRAFEPITLTINGKRMTFRSADTRKMNARMFEMGAKTGLFSGTFGDIRRTKGTSFYVDNPETYIAAALYNNTPEAFIGMSQLEFDNLVSKSDVIASKDIFNAIPDIEDMSFDGLASVQLMQSKEINDQLWLHGTNKDWTGLPSKKDPHHTGYYLTNDIRTSLDYTRFFQELGFLDKMQFAFDRVVDGNRIPVEIRPSRNVTQYGRENLISPKTIGHIHAYETTISNPFVIDASGQSWGRAQLPSQGNFKELVQRAYANGYDSVLVKNFVDTMQSQTASDVLIVFNPTSTLKLPGANKRGNKLEEALRSQETKIANPFIPLFEYDTHIPGVGIKQGDVPEDFNVPSAFVNTKYTQIANNGIVEEIGGDAWASPYLANVGARRRKQIAGAESIAQMSRLGLDNVLQEAYRAAAMGDIDSFNKHVEWLSTYSQQRLQLLRDSSTSLYYPKDSAWASAFQLRYLFPSISPSVYTTDNRLHLIGNVVIEQPTIGTTAQQQQPRTLALLGNVSSIAKSLGQPNAFVTSTFNGKLSRLDTDEIRKQMRPENSLSGEQYVPCLEVQLDFGNIDPDPNLMREIADFAPDLFNGIELSPRAWEGGAMQNDPSVATEPMSLPLQRVQSGTLRIFMVPDQYIGYAEAKEWHDAANAKWKEFVYSKIESEAKQKKYRLQLNGKQTYLALWNLGSSEFGGIGKFTEYDRVLDIVRAVAFDEGISFQTQEKQLASSSMQYAIERSFNSIFTNLKFSPGLEENKFPLLNSNSYNAVYPSQIEDARFAFRKIASSIPVQSNLAYNWSLQPDDALDKDPMVGKTYDVLVKRLNDLHLEDKEKPFVRIKYEFAPTQTNTDGTVQSIDMYNANIHNMWIDIVKNKHLYIPKSTEQSFGMSDAIRAKHPMWAESQIKDVNGVPMRNIDLLNGLRRAVNATQYFSTFNGVGENLDYTALAIMVEDPLGIWALANEIRLPDNYMANRNVGPNGENNFSPLDTASVPMHKLSLPPYEDIYTGHARVDDVLRAYRSRLNSTSGGLFDPNGAVGTLAKINPDADELPQGSGNAQESLGGSVMVFNKPGKKDVDIDPKNLTMTADFDEVGEDFLANMVFMPNPAPTKQQSIQGAGQVNNAAAMGHKPNPNPNLDVRRAIRTARHVLNEIGKAGAAGDASPILLQGYVLTLDNPAALITQLRMLKNVINNPNLGIEFNGKVYNKEGMKGRKYFHDALDQVIRNRPTYQYAKHLGLTLAASNMENELARLQAVDPNATYDDVDDLGDAVQQEINLKWMRHLPGHGQSQRFFALAKDAQKMTAFDAFARHLVDLGYNPTALFETNADGDVLLDKYGKPKMVNSSWNKALREAAALMNVASGDVRLAKQDEIDRSVSELYSLTIFSPRWWMSRMMLDRVSRAMFEKTGNVVGSAFGDPEWATKILKLNRLDDRSMLSRDKNVGAYHAKIMWQAWGMLMALIGLLYGSQALNPKTLKVMVDKNGTRLRVGDYTLRAPGAITTGVEMISMMFEAAGEWKARTGNVNEPDLLPFILQKVTSPLLTKASPLLSFGAEFATGRDAFGQPAFVPDEALKTFGDEIVAPYLRATGIRGFETPKINQALTKRVFWWWLHDIMESYKSMRDVNVGKGEALLKSSLMGAFSFVGGRVLYAPESQRAIWNAQKRMEGASGLDVFLGKSSGMDMLTGKLEMAGDNWNAHMGDYDKYMYTNKPREWLIGTPPDAPNVWY